MYTAVGQSTAGPSIQQQDCRNRIYATVDHAGADIAANNATARAAYIVGQTDAAKQNQWQWSHQKAQV